LLALFETLIAMTEQVLVVDNGADTIKFGRASWENPRLLRNCTARMSKNMQTLVGDDVENITNGSLLRYTRPFDRGYLVNWNTEMEVWSMMLDKHHLDCSDPSSHSLVLTEPPVNFEALQNDTNEVIFEEFGFDRYLRRSAPWFSAYEFAHHFDAKHMKRGPGATAKTNQQEDAATCAMELDVDGSSSSTSNSDDDDPSRHPSPSLHSVPARSCCVVIDCGFSFSHVVPFTGLCARLDAATRVNVGGKLLTNYLKETVSYRQWNMMDEFKLMEQVKQEVCYISPSPCQDLLEFERLRNNRGTLVYDSGLNSSHPESPAGRAAQKLSILRRHFVLPDFQNIMRGFVLPLGQAPSPGDQVLSVETERFTVPEVLFRPSILGMSTGGLVESGCARLVSQLDLSSQALACPHFVLTGGSCLFPGFQERFDADVRSVLPAAVAYNSFLPREPQMYAWQGARHFASDEAQRGRLASLMVSRQEYLDQGHERINARMRGLWVGSG
jgi:actin-related protein 6